MKRLLLALALAVPAAVMAQERLVFTDATRIDYPGEIDLGTGTGQQHEEWFRQDGRLQVRNVERATLTPFLPDPNANTGAAVIVAPGGGFLGLAIEEEGYRVARWLSDHGIAAFVLKYRVLPTPVDPATFRREIKAVRAGGTASFRPPADTTPEALADAQAALRHVRANAMRYGIDPARTGMMGFSAGAFTTVSVATATGIDAAPDFIAPIYGKQDAVVPPANPPPLFVALASDDFFWKGSSALIDSWRRAGGKTEFHLFQSGGHGFGLGAAGTTTADWIEGFRRWLDANAMLRPKGR